jgi:hypothetical protein
MAAVVRPVERTDAQPHRNRRSTSTPTAGGACRPEGPSTANVVAGDVQRDRARTARGSQARRHVPPHAARSPQRKCSQRSFGLTGTYIPTRPGGEHSGGRLR